MTVYLVGAGPGDPELLTLKAARLLGEADVVIHDRLVSDAVMDMVSPWTLRVDVGKDPNGASTPQETINQYCVEYGRRSRVVVRLKGGDPFVFGRGGEEVLALAEAGIDVEVVPGITSALAGPAAAGIPVTHRHLSSGFTVLTGHQDPANPRRIDWRAAAQLGTTLVILMGVRHAASIATELIAGGMAPATPVAVIEAATTERQRVLRLELQRLTDTADPVAIANPAVIVVGDVADPQRFAALTTTTTTTQPTDRHMHELLDVGVSR